MRSMVLVLAACVLLPDAMAEPLFLVRFQATFNDEFGFPGASMVGSYEFEQQPASGRYPMQSASISLNGIAFSTTPLEIRIDNDLPLSIPFLLRDAYYATALVSGTFMGNFALQGAGLAFEQLGPAPSAFNSFDLPTSVADLSGFGPTDLRSAFLTFQNLQQGGLSAIYGTLEDISITAVPEVPMAMPLCALVLGLIIWAQRRGGSNEVS
jgi:hypothetical protein